jgi:exodeoxyribonuclease V gamma subunit
VLYVSWSGRSVRDDSEQPPSVLVAQLRDYLSARWSAQTVDDRTATHPLQPFSRRYFEAGSELFTHAHEWRAAIDEDSDPSGDPREPPPGKAAEPSASSASSTAADPTPPPAPAPPRLSVPALVRLLRNPPRTYFESTLGIFLSEDEPGAADNEPFTLDSLDTYQLLDSITQGVLAELRDELPDDRPRTDPAHLIEGRLLRLEREGRLPLGGPGVAHRKALAELAAQPVRAWMAERDQHPHTLERLPLRIELGGTLIEAFTPPRFSASDLPQPAIQLHASANTLLAAPGKPRPMPYRLIDTWVQALLLGASGLSDQLVLIGRDATVRARPPDPDHARERLLELLALYREACVEPLPVAAKTAIEYCDTQTEDGAASVYEGSEHVRGEVADPVLARLFPDFEALTADGRFAGLANGCYAELVRWVGTHVTALPHAKAESATEPRSGRADE